MKYLVCGPVLGALLLALPATARAQHVITLIAPGGARAAIEALIPGFENKTGFQVKATFGSGLGTKAQAAKGDDFDVKVIQPPLASVAVGVVVKKGAPEPDISNAAAVKKMLLAASSITYPDPSGGAAA